MTVPMLPPIEDDAPMGRGYLTPGMGMSGIGRAMRDRAMGAGMMQRPITPPRPDSDMLEAAPRPPDEVYKKGGRVKRKSDMGHMSHADHVKKHYAVGGFIHHSDHAKKMCGGGYMKGKK
ncbi:hypothetical protein EBZ39_03850 [bacterium]|nr:hypothetical protein [bacterium]